MDVNLSRLTLLGRIADHLRTQTEAMPDSELPEGPRDLYTPSEPEPGLFYRRRDLYPR